MQLEIKGLKAIKQQLIQDVQDLEAWDIQGSKWKAKCKALANKFYFNIQDIRIELQELRAEVKNYKLKMEKEYDKKVN